MTELSPAALKIRDAAEKESDLDFRYAPQIAAAAIEALADQVVPAMLHPADKEFWPDEEDERQWQYDRCKRAEILAIAAELRGTTTP